MAEEVEQLRAEGKLRAFCHLAFCARAIFRREAIDITRVGWFACLTVPEPFNDSITKIA
jgi:hypothetical protein